MFSGWTHVNIQEVIAGRLITPTQSPYVVILMLCSFKITTEYTEAKQGLFYRALLTPFLSSEQKGFPVGYIDRPTSTSWTSIRTPMRFCLAKAWWRWKMPPAWRFWSCDAEVYHLVDWQRTRKSSLHVNRLRRRIHAAIDKSSSWFSLGLGCLSLE